MSHFKVAGVDDWADCAAANPLLCALVGVTSENFPGASTHRDFWDRLWMAGKPNRLKSKGAKPVKKYGKVKQPPKHPRIVKYLVD